ncbi:unnamed protein product [Eruca vesicaria subsp. sativa]|uniref:ATPase AAA-type core domain-containing protein n=1 Tax=Eruca vesicaria subsp. sativa TaxID=29727 RepID=A0ABC8LCK7_ERUVS|nr:unnamed protein product [Eruca vesicaria subsp. sativa]
MKPNEAVHVTTNNQHLGFYKMKWTRILSVVGILKDEVDLMVSVMKAKKGSSADIGGLEAQFQEIKEAVELPLTHPELYEDIGIKPLKGVILYGEPETGKTLLAMAVANSTSTTFLRVVGSELIQKYLGDGPTLIPEKYNPATWMLEASSLAAELKLGVDFAELYNNSSLCQ